MKLFKAIMLGITMVFVISLCGCSGQNDYEGKTKVIFELEGGVYQNCTLPVKHYYDVEEGETQLIYELNHFSEKNFEKAGYVLQGWFKTKTVNGDSVTYSDEWDFETDKITKDGITLYAYWKKAISYTYNVCYKDENNQVVVLGDYDVDTGSKFNDYLNYSKKRDNYTPIDYVDEFGNPWDFEFKHPGGEEDLAINVYVNYIKGDYKLVRTASDLKKYKNDNIYLMNDIDMNGEKFSFGNYKKDFQGNGYTISNFSIQYSGGGTVQDLEDPNNSSLYISLFSSLDGANIENVSFENVSVVVNTTYSKIYKIYVAPLATKIVDSTIKNVTINGTYSCEKLPNNFNKDENLVYVTNKLAYLVDDKSILDNNKINIQIEEKEI